MSKLQLCQYCNQTFLLTEASCPHCKSFQPSQADPLDESMMSIYGAPPWEEMEIDITDITIETSDAKQKEHIKKMLLYSIETSDKSVFVEENIFQIELSVQAGKIIRISFLSANLTPAQMVSLQNALEGTSLQRNISGKIFCSIRFST